MIIYNGLGLLFLAIGFGTAFGIGAAIGTTEEGPLMLIAGPLIALIDLVYRSRSDNGHWFKSYGGGSLFYLPLWAFGLLWMILGIVDTFGRGR